MLAKLRTTRLHSLEIRSILDSGWIAIGMRRDPRLENLSAVLAAVPSDMALQHFGALVAVASQPGLSVNDLAERIGAPQQSASRYVSALMGRYHDPLAAAPPLPLLDQRVSEDDPRRRALFLTAAGDQLVGNILAAGWPESTN